MPYFVLLDDALSGRAKLYRQHRCSQFLTADRLDELDGLLQSGWQRGWHAVVFADYAFGLPLLKLPQPAAAHLALHWFAESAELDAPEAWLQSQYDADTPSGISTRKTTPPKRTT